MGKYLEGNKARNQAPDNVHHQLTSMMDRAEIDDGDYLDSLFVLSEDDVREAMRRATKDL